MKTRVLVTGANGLIGRQTIGPLLDSGFDVVTVSRTGSGPGSAVNLAGDLLADDDRRRVLLEARATHLLHLAWHDAPKGRWTDPANLDWAAATVGLVRDFAALGGKRALLAGSCAEYDWSHEELGEDTPLVPSSLYGKCKARTGQLLMDAAGDIGLGLAWARIFFCYGPGEPSGRLVGDLVRGLSAGQAVDCTDGEQIRDYMHTGDIGRALVMTLASNLAGAVNICSGEPTRVADLISCAARLAGRPDLIRLGALPRPLFDPPRLVGRCARLQSIGFAPEFSLERGLKDCLRQFEDSL